MSQIKDPSNERNARRALAACHRLFDFLNWTEAIFNHITLRVPGNDSEGPLNLINPFGLHCSEVTASNLLKIDLEGNDVQASGQRVNRAGFVVHSAIHEARSDAHCIIHVHTTAGCAVARKQSGLHHDSFYSAMLYDEIAYDDYEGVTTSIDEQPHLVASLGDKNYLILRNHGLLVTGATLSEAFQRVWMLQRACEIQLTSDAGLGPKHPVPPKVLEQVPATRLGKQVGQESRAHLEREFPGRATALGVTNPDFAVLVRSYGGHGKVVKRTEDFSAALARAGAFGNSERLPALVELRYDSDGISPGETLSNIRAAATAKQQAAAASH